MVHDVSEGNANTTWTVMIEYKSMKSDSYGHNNNAAEGINEKTVDDEKLLLSSMPNYRFLQSMPQ